MERFHSRELADDDQPDAIDRHADLPKPVEQPDQVQLIEQVVLEPEHDFVFAGRTLDGLGASGKGRSDVG